MYFPLTVLNKSANIGDLLKPLIAMMEEPVLIKWRWCREVWIELLQHKLFFCTDKKVVLGYSGEEGFLRADQFRGRWVSLAPWQVSFLCLFFSFVFRQLITCSHTRRSDSHATAFTETTRGTRSWNPSQYFLIQTLKKIKQTKLNKTERNKTMWALRAWQD